jgi:hypothetical protein
MLPVYSKTALEGLRGPPGYHLSVNPPMAAWNAVGFMIGHPAFYSRSFVNVYKDDWRYCNQECAVQSTLGSDSQKSGVN